jgi:exosortase/archaeosortase family protein
MLWVGMFLTFVLLCLYELPIIKSTLLVLLAFVVIIGANVFRAVALFYLEAGVLNSPSWGHEYAGVIAFVLEAAGIVSILFMLQRRKVCGEVVTST